MAGHVKPQESSRMMLEHDNVAGGRLARFSVDPPTGFNRDGYCRVTDDDSGNHSVASTVTSSFLDFTNSKGNNLNKAGVKPDMKWCLCASRWKEAYDAFKDGKLEKDAVPKVHLHATDKKALDVVTYAQLKEFRAEPEALREGGRQGITIDPTKPGSTGFEERDISGHRPGSDQHYGKTQDGQKSVAGAYAEMSRRNG